MDLAAKTEHTRLACQFAGPVTVATLIVGCTEDVLTGSVLAMWASMGKGATLAAAVLAFCSRMDLVATLVSYQPEMQKTICLSNAVLPATRWMPEERVAMAWLTGSFRSRACCSMSLRCALPMQSLHRWGHRSAEAPETVLRRHDQRVCQRRKTAGIDAVRKHPLIMHND